MLHDWTDVRPLRDPTQERTIKKWPWPGGGTSIGYLFEGFGKTRLSISEFRKFLSSEYGRLFTKEDPMFDHILTNEQLHLIKTMFEVYRHVNNYTLELLKKDLTGSEGNALSDLLLSQFDPNHINTETFNWLEWTPV